MIVDSATLDSLVLEFENPKPPPWREQQQETAERVAWECDLHADTGRDYISTPLTDTLIDAEFGDQCIEAPTGSGKTHAAIQLGIATPPHSTAILATNTLRAQRDIVSGLHGGMDTELVADLHSGERVGALHSRSEGSAFRVVVTNHANLAPRGDWPAEQGRLWRKLAAGLREGMPKPRVVVDEADAWLNSMARVHIMGYRTVEDTDEYTGLPMRIQVHACPRKCDACTLANGMHGAASAMPRRYALTDSARPPDHAAAVDVDSVVALGAGSDGYRSHGWEIRPVNHDLAEVLAHERKTSIKEMDGAERPSGLGILAAIAASPGATLRRAYPRDSVTGSEIPVSEAIRRLGCGERRTIVFPRAPCNIWRLCGWDLSPLRALREYASVATLMSGSWSPTARALVGDMPMIGVRTPPARKMREVLLLAVAEFAWNGEHLARFGRAAPTLAFRSTMEAAEAMRKSIVKTGIGSVFLRGEFRTPSHSGIAEQVIVSYPRSSLGRGLNLGSRRTVIVDADVYDSIGGAAMSGWGAEGPLEALEAARREWVAQAVGRCLRGDESGARDDLRRVVVLVGGRERDGTLSDDGEWLEKRLRGMCETVKRIELAAFPGRAIDAAEQFHAGEAVTVTDDPEEDASMSHRQKALTAQRAKELKAARKAERLLTKREEIIDALIAARQAGESWRDVARRLHLSRYFPKEEAADLRKRYELA